MQDRRRGFLKASIMAAGGAALGASVRARSGVAGAAGDDPVPPTRRFVEAVAAGDEEAVRRWLDRDPGLIHARDDAGRTAFAIALIHRHPGIAGLLRDRGYPPDLHESALAVDWERFERLAAATPGAVNQDHPVGGTAMYAAAVGGAGSQIWRVYRFGGEPDLRGASGYSPLRAALEHPDLDVAELTASGLLGNGADPAAEQADGSSPLHVAARRGSTAIVELLIRKGADVEALDRGGRTARRLADEAGRAEVVELLDSHRTIPRDHSTSREAYDVAGRAYRRPDLSAFSIGERSRVVGVAHGGFDDLRQAVNRHPELAHAISTTTESAVEAGAHTGHADIVDLLIEHGAAYSLPTAVMRGDLARARALLDEDPLRIHERGPHDFALLWYPVIGQTSTEMLELLLARGAEVERQHVLGTTALHFASLRGAVEMAELLIAHGADVNRPGRRFDATPETPLQLAEARGHQELVRLLRAHGARG
ncbi:MAG TPA: ankyrin repeat domain-containing protein [Candidatus Polarisedimenticolaceae bacterium]|nr:ankyrin repeat domain-containing protein [Candidatus Polarisedimenticolaceae bacterium]